MNEDGVALAQWLQEAGRRRARPRAHRGPIRPRDNARQATTCFLRSGVLLLAGSAAVAQYCYADTMLGILSIHSILVFVLP